MKTCFNYAENNARNEIEKIINDDFISKNLFCDIENEIEKNGNNKPWIVWNNDAVSIVVFPYFNRENIFSDKTGKLVKRIYSFKAYDFRMYKRHAYWEDYTRTENIKKNYGFDGYMD